MSKPDWEQPLITGNSMLLMGVIAGSIRNGYATTEADPGSGEMILEFRDTGNRFKVSVCQISGKE